MNAKLIISLETEQHTFQEPHFTYISVTKWANFLKQFILDEVHPWVNQQLDRRWPTKGYKPHLHKAKLHHILKTVFSPELATVYLSHWLTQEYMLDLV